MNTTIRTIVRFVALCIILAHFTYRAGYATGRFVAHASDWLAEATKSPLATATSLATRAVEWAEMAMAEPTPPQPDLLTMLGARVLTVSELDAEIAEYDKAQRKKAPDRTARRKPATVRKAKAVAAA